MMNGQTYRGFSLLLLAVLAVLSGCNIVGGAVSILAPPELVEAKYKMPDKKTLVVIDDDARRVNDQTILNRMAGAIRANLEHEGVVTAGFVGQDELAAVRDELGTAYANTSLAALGLKLGASQVVHVQVVGYQLEVGGSVYQPTIVSEVKVFDIDQRARVFPAADPVTGGGGGSASYTLQTKMTARDMSGRGTSARYLVARDLADESGRDIARLFFDWRRPDKGSTLGERR